MHLGEVLEHVSAFLDFFDMSVDGISGKTSARFSGL